MHLFRRSILGILFIAFWGLCTACGKSASPESADAGPDLLASHPPISGSLTENVQKVLHGKNADDCDRSEAAMRLEIAQAIDGRADELAELSPRGKASGKYRRVRLGNSFVRELVAPLEPKPGDYEDFADWSELYDGYLKIKNDPTDQDWVNLNRRVRSILLDDRCRAIEGENYSLDRQARRDRFYPNRWVKRPSRRELILPLDSGSLGESEAQLAGYIESVWAKPDLQLKIQWGNVQGAFKIIFGEEFGERSYVTFSDRIVHLFPDIRTKSIAHEIGHVLGFRDHYYTIWHPEACKYVIQGNEGDLMSDPDTGVVTEEEWAELDRQYPAP